MRNSGAGSTLIGPVIPILAIHSMTNTDSQDLRQEVRNLKETINALRAALEAQQLEGQRHLQDCRRSSKEQIRQLQETIDRMRMKLEEEYYAREAHVQKVTQSLNDQLRQSQQAVIALRAQLEQAKNG